MIGRIRQRRAHGIGRRLLDRFRATWLGGIAKGQRVWFVTFGGERYKRVIFADSYQATRVAQALEAMAVADGGAPPARHFPELLTHVGREVWTRYVHGAPPDPDDPAHRQLVAEFFAAVYRHRPESVDATTSPMPARLDSDLRFLADCGVLPRDRAETLAAAGRALCPERLLVGHDYVDPVIKNFLVAGNRIVAIDLESLQDGHILGTGVAKCRVHWLDETAGEFARRVVAAGAPDFTAQMPFAELCFLAAWSKRKILTGKAHRVDPQRFQAF